MFSAYPQLGDVLSAYKEVVEKDLLLSVPFTSLTSYLWLLKVRKHIMT